MRFDVREDPLYVLVTHLLYPSDNLDTMSSECGHMEWEELHNYRVWVRLETWSQSHMSILTLLSSTDHHI